MSEETPYKLEHVQAAEDQIRKIATYAKRVGSFPEFARIIKQAARRLETNPHEWGDPKFRAKYVDAIVYHAYIGPVAFEYVIYESIRGVTLLTVKLYRDFA